MTEFTKEQISQYSTPLLRDMVEAHEKSARGDVDTIGLAKDELAFRAIQSTILPDTARFISKECDSDISPDPDFH